MQTFLDAGTPIGDQLDSVLAAISDARTDLDIDGALIVTTQRHRTQAAALEVLELIESWRDRILVIGRGATAERGNPPAKFASYYAASRVRGYRTTIHAGEDGPAEYIREALDVCRADRIDRSVGQRGPDVPPASQGGPADRCRTSRCESRRSMAAHPLHAMFEAGLLVTVNSDDPPYFGGYVNDNYGAARTHLGLDRAALADLARNFGLDPLHDGTHAVLIERHLDPVELEKTEKLFPSRTRAGSSRSSTAAASPRYPGTARTVRRRTESSLRHPTDHVVAFAQPLRETRT